ncbi:hypothetical protein GF378_01500 [Candidatus Pacearchaeota archaeon]|nr:hypothetical protein [Candidatus Pacearchaeota archaeon]
MEEKYAQELVECLKKRSGLVSFDESQVLDSVKKTIIKPSSRFYEMIVSDMQTIYENDRYHYLFTSKILRNKNAQNYELSSSKRLAMDLAEKIGIHSSTHASRRLRLETGIPAILKLAHNKGHPYSLLGRLDTYDVSQPDAVYKRRKPFLITPGENKNPVILSWEDIETNYEVEKPHWFFPLMRKSKKISEKKYTSALNSA